MNTIENPMKSNRRLLSVVVVSVCVIALLGIIQTADAEENTYNTTNNNSEVNRPVVNPYLASSLYASRILTLPRATLHPTGLLSVISL